MINFIVLKYLCFITHLRNIKSYFTYYIYISIITKIFLKSPFFKNIHFIFFQLFMSFNPQTAPKNSAWPFCHQSISLSLKSRITGDLHTNKTFHSPAVSHTGQILPLKGFNKPAGFGLPCSAALHWSWTFPGCSLPATSYCGVATRREKQILL